MAGKRKMKSLSLRKKPGSVGRQIEERIQRLKKKDKVQKEMKDRVFAKKMAKPAKKGKK